MRCLDLAPRQLSGFRRGGAWRDAWGNGGGCLRCRLLRRRLLQFRSQAFDVRIEFAQLRSYIAEFGNAEPQEAAEGGADESAARLSACGADERTHRREHHTHYR